MSGFDFSVLTPVIQTLGWTLLHFLWQGAAVGALFACGRLTLRLFGLGGNLRYGFGLFCLGLLGLAPALTFVWLWESPGLSAASATVLPSISITVNNLDAASSVTAWLERALPWLVLAWAAGVLTLSGRVLVSWRQARRMTREGIAELDDALMAKVRLLLKQFQVSRGVRVVESALVQVPTVIGWLKPVILLPTSALTGLTPTQLELVVAHELGHIRRFDYLVNLFQVALETLLFYHPVVRWISSDVRASREVCCDDMVVQQCGKATEYAKALLNLESMRGQVVAPGLAATEGPLLQRIQRMLDRPGKATATEVVPVPGHGVALGTLVLVAAAGIQGFQSQSVAAVQAVSPAPISAPALTLKEPTETVSDLTVESEPLVAEVEQAQSAETPMSPPTELPSPPAQTAAETVEPEPEPEPVEKTAVAAPKVANHAVEVASAQPLATDTEADAAAETPEPVPAAPAATEPSPVMPAPVPTSSQERVVKEAAPAAEPIAKPSVLPPATGSIGKTPVIHEVDQPTQSVEPERLELAKLELPQEPRVHSAKIRPVRTSPAVYPRVAERSSTEGYVVIEYTVRTNGKIGTMDVVESSARGMFDSAAKRALRDWRYSKADAAQAKGMKFRQRFSFTMTNVPADCQKFTGSRLCRDS